MSLLADNDDVAECPLCLEELDSTDRSFKPCPCGYHVCIWCYHNIREKLDGKCPACRAIYNPDLIEVIPTDDDGTSKTSRKRSKHSSNQSNQKRSRSGSGTWTTSTSGGGSGTTSSSSDGSGVDLASARILQRTLVYVVGLSPNNAKEEVLKKREFFGRFGKIHKIAINKKPHGVGATQSFSAYVTFKNAADAKVRCLIDPL